jgi:hypothetical protein
MAVVPRRGHSSWAKSRRSVAVLRMWAARGAVKLNLRRWQAGGFCQTGSVFGVALFGSLLDGMGVQQTCEEPIEDGC